MDGCGAELRRRYHGGGDGTASADSRRREGETTMELTTRRTRTMLWIVQTLLALLFLFAGGTKLVMPIEVLTAGTTLPGVFLRFIGVCEVLGAIGLILPELLRIRRGLTPLAAAALVIIM